MRLYLKLLHTTVVTASASGSRSYPVTFLGTHKHADGSSWAGRGFAGGANDPSGSMGRHSKHELHSTQRTKGAELGELVDTPPSLLANIIAVASDVDGTLASPEVTVTRRTSDAIKAILDSGLMFFPATGKTRAGMYKTMGKDLATMMKERNLPGVFNQGLVVYAGAGDDVIFERLLDKDVVALVSTFCEEQGMSLIGYSGDRIVCSKNDAQTDKVAGCMEIAPEAVGSLTEAMDAGLRIHKLIIMATTEAIDRVRPDVERLVGEGATVTQALSDMLEVLPPGASKGNGVAKLLEHLGVDPARVMAMGDAENDVGMLELAGVGVCVANASPMAKAAADFMVPSNAEEGAAVAMEHVLRSKSSEL